MHHNHTPIPFAVAILGALCLSTGCTSPSPHVAPGSASAPVTPDRIPPVVVDAADTVQIMTLPIIETAQCFPQAPVWVRRQDGVIQTADVALYANRRLDKAYHRVAFIYNGRVGYCTPLGEIVIAPRFDAGEVFQEGIAVVQSAGKYGYIDQFGQWIVKPELDFAYGFWYGVGAAKRQGKYGLIDHAGQWIKQPTFFHMAVVGGGIQAIADDGEEGFVDVRGNFIKSGELGSFYRPPRSK